MAIIRKKHNLKKFFPEPYIKTALELDKEMDKFLYVEICICAAVKATDGTIIRGHRHRDCRDGIVRRGKELSMKWEDEGFITSFNRFVDRKEAFLLQTYALKQSVNPEGYQLCGWLFSEDIY